MDNDPKLTPHFRKSELECHCGCGQAPLKKDFLDRLEAARLIYGGSITVARAYSCAKHNRKIGGGKDSAHTRGTAIDPVRPVGGAALHKMIAAFRAAGFHGFGMGLKKGKPYLHFDCDAKLGPRAWMY
ncbi:hypothetical protein LCGC14_2857930 [marine sediment metagenome]|uniref:Peptidase M15A C-terminal domain-containing protein n=1 Tax=marine sediment metagenome TaxID=412755 RepID=A0A0F9AEY1_9ZZZZ